MCVITFDWEENDAIKKFEHFGKSESISWCILDLTEHCNFYCKWCYANAGSIKTPVHMSVALLKKALDVLAGLGVRQITYSGGEPTLYPHLKEAVSLARRHGMLVHMNTNGYLLTKGLASELKKAGLSQVQTNIDSVHHPEKQDEVRGKKGSFENAVQALKNAMDAGITAVSVTVLTRENEGEVVDIFRFARRLGVQRCRIWDMAPAQGRARENSGLMPKDFLSVVQNLSDFAYVAGAANVEVGDPLFKSYIKTELPVSGGYCAPAAGMVIHVKTGGDVYFCCASRDRMYNLFEEELKGNDIRRVHRQSISRFLSAFPKPVDCQGCNYSDNCAGGCYARRDFSKSGADYWCTRCGN